METKQIKVLLSAYACEPGKGSEPYQGWHWALYLSKMCKVTVLTRANNREAIEKEITKLEGPKPDFIYYDPPKLFIYLKKKGLPVFLFYLIWQIGARFFVAKQMRNFDVIHHVTFCSFALPGFWWVKKPAVVLGPLGGGMVTPWCMLSVFGKHWWRELLRSVGIFLSAYNPALLLSFNRAKAILVANKETKDIIPKFFGKKITKMIEVGIDLTNIPRPQDKPQRRRFRFIWVGSFLPRKAAILAVEATALCKQRNINIELHLVGDGVERIRIENRIKELQLNDVIIRHGRVTHAQALQLIVESDAFLFTSARDTSGNVILEAMVAGLPGIVIAHQGASELTTDETAIRIKPDYQSKLTHELAAAMQKLANSPDLCRTMGFMAKKRALDNFTWDYKSQFIYKLYQQILEH
jgi:glycosyltransferase involved in cell wall biosynthesis